VENDSITLHGALVGLELKVAGAQQDETARLAAELGKPHGFRVDKNGKVTAIQLDAVGSVSSGLLAALVGSSQFVASNPSSKEWTADEEDGVGIYTARYRATSAGSYEKTKLKYTDVKAPANQLGIAARTEIVRSTARYSLDENLRLSSLDAAEETRVPPVDPLPELTSRVQLKLSLVRTERAPNVASLEQELSRLAPHALSAGPSREAVRLDTDRARIGTADLSNTLKELAALATAPAERRARLYSTLSALLRRQAGAVDDAKRRIRAGDAMKNTLIDALGDAATPDAQSALTELAKDKTVGEADRQRALTALTFVEAPSEATVTTLTELIDHPVHGIQARYGLGAAANHLATSDPERAKAVMKELTKRLQESQSPEQIVTYLRALGNAGDPASLPIIVPYLRHANMGVRAAAARALRKIQGPEVEKLLADVMRSDPGSMVRSSALDSCRDRSNSPTLEPAVDHVVRRDADRDTRRLAIDLAARWAPSSKTLAAALAWAAEHDTDASLRELAARHVADLSKRAGPGPATNP
jgi:hypothetical protein